MSNSPHRGEKKNTFSFFLNPPSLPVTLSTYLVFLLLTLSLLSLFRPFSFSPYRTMARYKILVETIRDPGPSLVDPLLWHDVFSQQELNYIFMVAQINKTLLFQHINMPPSQSMQPPICWSCVCTKGTVLSNGKAYMQNCVSYCVPHVHQFTATERYS